MNGKLSFCAVFCWLLLLLGRGLPAEAADQVFVSVVPQKFFVEKVSGGTIEVEVMVPPGASPATYEPKPSQMRKLATSSAYFAIGVPFEKAWLGKIAGVNPKMKIVHTEEGIERIAMAEHAHDGESPESGQDKHDGLDPHIWLSPPLVKKQAAVIRDNLTEMYPEQKAAFQENFALFSSEIDKLDTGLREILKNKRGLQFMVFHPSWGYFARQYGLQQVAIEIEGKSPKPAQLQELIRHAKEHKISVIFAQPQFSDKSARLIAQEIGGEVIMVDPLAENWLQNMTAVAEKFREAIH